MKITLPEEVMKEAALMFLQKVGLADEYTAEEVKFTNTRSPAGTEVEILLKKRSLEDCFVKEFDTSKEPKVAQEVVDKEPVKNLPPKTKSVSEKVEETPDKEEDTVEKEEVEPESEPKQRRRLGAKRKLFVNGKETDEGE